MRLHVFSAVALFLSLTSCVIQRSRPTRGQRSSLIAGYMPQSILDAFTAETGIHVKYEVYADQARLWSSWIGKVVDLVVLITHTSPSRPPRVYWQLNYANIPNFRNVSPGFRILPSTRATPTDHNPVGTTAIVRTDRPRSR